MKNSFPKACLYLVENPRTWYITGAAGYVGMQLTDFLLGLNQHVIGIDDLSSSAINHTSEIRALHEFDANFDFYEGDVRNGYTVYNTLRYQDVKHFVHLAALRSVPKSYENPVEVADVNVMGTLTAANEAISTGVESFVYASSSSVYGYNADQKQCEWMRCEPISPYSRSKYAAEKLIETLDRQNTGITGLRFFNIYGSRQDGWADNATVVSKFVDRLVTEKPIEIYGSANIARDFVHINDVIQSIIMASLFSKDSAAEIYNIGSGKSFTLDYIVKQIDNILCNDYKKPKREILIRYLEERIGDVPFTCADISKAEVGIGYQPNMELREGLMTMIQDSINRHKPNWM
jgi:UDP-N-acetylglucosamine 4-epimerase